MTMRLSKQIPQQELADHALIQRACAGDSSAFELLVDRYQSTLYRFVSAYLGKDEAPDVVQFVWLQFYRSLPQLQRTRPVGWTGRDVSLKAWLFRVAWNRCLDERRRNRKRPWLFSELERVKEEEDTSILSKLPDPAPLPEELAEHLEEQHRLRAAIQRLPSALRAVVWLRYTEALSFSEIGQRLHIPPSTAKTYYYRSRSWLRVALLSPSS